MKTKIAAILAAAALAVSLGACSNDPEAAPAPTVTITEQAPDTGPTVDEAYVSTVRTLAPKMSRSATDADLIDLGKTTCLALDELNGDTEALFYVLYDKDPNLDYGEVGAVVGASITAYCPEYSSEIGSNA